MKMHWMIAFLFYSSVVNTFAANKTSPSPQGLKGQKDQKEQKNHPCHDIIVACETAGFKKHDSNIDKRLFHSCVKPIMLNQVVAGVSIDASKVKACQDKRKDWIEKKLRAPASTSQEKPKAKESK